LALVPTHGCVRVHNADLRDKIVPLLATGTVFVSVYQEKA
jgi:L,D-peptidoglycan transpeptidase YkuD (ErfK/YbiS/YcfS/YnhG family)